MSIAAEKTKITYITNKEKEFVIPFRFIEDSDIRVYIGDDLQIFERDYSIKESKVIFEKDIAGNSKVIILRETKISQESIFMNNSKLPAEVLNFCFDKLTMICQELSENSIHYSGEDDIDFNSLIADLIKVQDFVSNADELSVSATKAAVSAAQALISAINAAQYAEAAKYVSGIPEHNENKKAHEDIRTLISELRKAFNTHEDNYDNHIKDYAEHITENNDDHNNFSNDINNLNERLLRVENINKIGKGNSYWAFGINTNGMLGIENANTISNAPIELPFIGNIEKIAICSGNSLMIAQGNIYVTGLGASGFCGPEMINSFGFKLHSSLISITNWTDIACYGEAAIAIKDENLYGWGKNANNIMGFNDKINRGVPKEIVIIENGKKTHFAKVYAGPLCFFAIDTTGGVWSIGHNYSGQLGHGDKNNLTEWKKIQEFSEIKIQELTVGGFVSSGKGYGFVGAISETGEVYLWGRNAEGELGNGTTTDITTPTLISNNDLKVQKIAMGNTHTCVLTDNGSLYIAGAKEATKRSANSLDFIKIDIIENDTDPVITNIAAGYNVTYIVADNALFGIGTSANGNLLGKTSTTIPVKLLDVNIEQIYAPFNSYSCAYTVAEEVADETV